MMQNDTAPVSFQTDHDGHSKPEDSEEAESSSDDDSSINSEEEADEDDSFGGLLFDRSAMKQHTVAALIAVVAAALGHAHLTGGSVGDLLGAFAQLGGGGGGSTGGSPTSGAPTRRVDLLGTPTPYGGGSVPTHAHASSSADDHNHHHHHAYKRTFGLGFCEDESIVESVGGEAAKMERVRRLLQDDSDRSGSNKWRAPREDEDVDRNLEPFDFRVSADLVDIMGLHYAADAWRDDSYLRSFEMLMNGKGAEEGGDGVSLPMDKDHNYRCLSERAAEMSSSSTSSAKSTLPGWSVAYIRPDISTFYPDGAPGPTGKASSKEIEVKAVHPSFTGFAAKFTNLGHTPLHLYWDGERSGSGARVVGTVPPFESIGTATTAGQSFHITPTYDKDHVLKRWTLTADEALVIYDPYKSRDRTDAKNKAAMGKDLSIEQKMRYQMQLLNTAYARDYLVKTGRVWLGNFPRPVPFHRMWGANYFGEAIKVRTDEAHFTSLPARTMLTQLGYDDYDGRSEADSGGDRLPLSVHRAKGGLDLTLEVVSCAPRVFRIDHFLSKIETEHIIGLATDGSRNVTLEQSTVHPGGGWNHGERENRQTDTSTRSSTNAWVEREASPIIDAIYRRAADVLRIDESLLRHRAEHEHTDLTMHHSIAERMQLVHYGVGGEYTPHHDFMYPGATNRYQPGRFATLLLYLNDVDEGGETVFPRAVNAEFHDGIEIKPKAGTALLFYDVLPDGNYDDLSQHSSKRVEKGEKWLANLWVWDPVID